ncbi:uncharacterized protein LOC107853471 isoform X4 [Capsicum annuum]|uniref:uncharacterized protein LOC107853471 isoform X4 n=1 Tax=Capsicum annuum TaxID=4072 RepID=UPI0007BF4435|nr:uncharacterized protein LOC107853471 isoform X4 [Capsicum annuum]
MVSPHGIKLAVYLISSYFGDLNAKVCDCLLRRGTQPLSQIVHFTEFSRENVKSCLLVLIHHNYVQAFAVQQKGTNTNTISDTTFVEKKDAVKILCKLWKDEYLEMKKVITQGARQSEFILWKINKQSLWKHVLDKMYHAALNLRLRITNEREQGKENQILGDKMIILKGMTTIYSIFVLHLPSPSLYDDDMREKFFRCLERSW